MKSFSFKEPWVNSYVERLLGLSAATKRAIIRALERSMGPKQAPRKGLSDTFWKACGAWESDESAEELAATIRNARTVNPDREPL
jgi:hypothetical protein